jgi:hypothetical protein
VWGYGPGRKNTILDQPCGRRRGSNSERAAWVISALRRASGRSSARPMLSPLEPSSNLLQIGDIVAVDVDRHDLPAALLARAFQPSASPRAPGFC